MSLSGRNGRTQEEMFMNKPMGQEAPEPLRINKRGSTASPAPSAVNQQGFGPPPTQGSTAYPMPALPYPDGPPRQQQPGRPNGSPAPYPYPDMREGGSPDQGRGGNMGAMPGGRRSGSANSNEYPTALRPSEGRRPSQTLAERRGTAPKPLPDSPGPEAPDKEGIFQRMPYTAPSQGSFAGDPSRQMWPAPMAGGSTYNRLNVRDPSSVNRISSTASTSTTRAQRGSPPPPETPITGPSFRPQTDIEARYAASGIPGAGTLTSMQAQSMAAQQRAANYGGQASQQQVTPARRPWTPTEQPGSAHPAPTVYQGADAVGASPGPASYPAPQPTPSPQPARIPQNTLDGDMARLQVNDEPPPAYSQVSGAAAGARHPNEKQRRSTEGGGLAAAAAAATAVTVAQQSTQQNHPAFANDPSHVQPSSLQQTPQVAAPVNQQVTMPQRQPSQNHQVPPASPPPLPEGWIAHMDPNSGQYYYIHLPTQSTQWEFPKGPTPLNMNETPLSPTGSFHKNALASPGLFSHQPLASPGIPMTPGYDGHNMMSMSGGLSSPAAFTGPPPSSGVDMYKVAAANGVYFGPYLRYTNMDLERGMWLGSIMLVTDAQQPPTIHIHQSNDLSPNPRQLKALNIATHQRWTFYKYELDLKMDESGAARWTYAITSHLGCTRYEFFVAGRHETNWRFVATSGNDFSLNVGANERARLGGVGFMWKDIMQKHAECGGFHCQLGLGSQIYADRLWKEIPSLKQWLAMSGKENRKNAVWTAAHEEDVTHAYFHYYTSHFDQPHLREAFAQIPYILTLDDHDM